MKTMKTQVCPKLTLIHYKTGLYVTTEPMYQAVADFYDCTKIKTTAGIAMKSKGICQDLNFHLIYN